jgi:DNA-binding transcriptional LysR family regulator
MNQMHIRSLKIFCDVVDLASFSRAAEANGVSQSNASQVVHQLEERLGMRLLDRSKRPFVLTPEGERFHEGCRVIVQRFQDLEREVQSLHETVASRLTVASIYSVGLAHMTHFLREFLSVHPHADVRMEYLHPHRVYEAVDSGQADLGLVSFPEPSRSLAVITWRTETMMLVCPLGHLLTRRPRVPLETLHGENFISLQQGLKIRAEIDKMLARRGVEVRVSLEFDNIETIKRAIEAGAGVSLLPAPTVEREVAAGTLVAVPLSGEPLVRPLGIIHRRDRKLSDTAQRFVEMLRGGSNEVGPPTINGRSARQSSPRAKAAAR